MMTSAQDPFYIVKDEIQESIDKLHDSFRQWEETPYNSGEHLHLTKQLLANCESIKWQVDELDKAIAVAASDPAWYGLDEVELDKRRRWTNIARIQVGTVRKALEDGRKKSNSINLGSGGMHRELMRLPNVGFSQAGRSNNYAAEDNDDFISAESDRQMLLIKQQDEELDDLSVSVQRIGDVGLTINEELIGQERILDDMSVDMETTSNRLGFVQKKVAMVMKKAGAKGQIMMILFLIVLFIVLFVLVFFT
ncbi:syntaxin-61-like isoform X2 [Phoenix dactylifera]|uniref:Syntaxin-61-like isoform X2 n=1 Tax=Phoenix dactylifera TaxID=42345 RepID=A0A8B7CSW1_PHODC|nr:syntaxin-61-like isoform X2 [Phoenix dactylifera]